QRLGNLLGLVIQRVAERENLAVAFAKFRQPLPHPLAFLGRFQLGERRWAAVTQRQECPRPLSAIAMESALALVLGQITGNAQQPGSRMMNHRAVLRFSPEPAKAFLSNVQSRRRV